MVAVNISYAAASGATLYAGRFAPPTNVTSPFDSVGVLIEGTGSPQNVQNQIPVLWLHASGGQNTTANRQYRATVSGDLAYEEHTQYAFRTVGALSGSFNGNKPITQIRPVSDWGKYGGSGARREGWKGFVFRESPEIHLIEQRRLDALYQWMESDLAAESNPARIDMSKICCTGGSMGGWGTMYYGLRRPRKFAALYPDRPRWRWDYVVDKVDYAVYDLGGRESTAAGAPVIAAKDGGGNLFDKIHDSIAYVSNPANFVPFIGWCLGRGDVFARFEDSIDAVNALRANGRPFAFAWNDGNHGGGSILAEILASYPYGTFEIGKGCPLFTEHSLDQDPNIDLIGGINIGLSFRSVIETPTGWACEVTSIRGPCTVKVKPCNSDVFTANVAAKLVTIPAANSWVAVSFTA